MRKRGKYSPEFREQAVKQTMSGSFTIKEVAESLGISYYVLRKWRAEFFFATLKREIEFNYFLDVNEAKKYIFDFIDLFYNRQRSHSFLGYVSPEEFERKAA